jgi:hypothetical protein
MNNKDHQGNITLVLGGTGKTGRRVAKRLIDRNVPVRIGSRSGEPPFDWDNQSTWAPVLQNVHSVYMTYYPDLAVPGAADAIRAFTDLAVLNNVQQLVLLSGRGEEEAQRCERVVQIVEFRTNCTSELALPEFQRRLFSRIGSQWPGRSSGWNCRGTIH